MCIAALAHHVGCAHSLMQTCRVASMCIWRNGRHSFVTSAEYPVGKGSLSVFRNLAGSTQGGGVMSS